MIRSSDWLHSADAGWRLFFEESAQPMWVYDAAKETISAANEAAASCYRVEVPKLVGRPIDEVVPAADARKLLRTPTRPGKMIAGGHHRRFDGETFDVEIAVRPLDESDLTTFLVTISDISVQSRDARRLHAHASQMADAQSVAHFGSFEWDIRSDEVTWSDELYRIFGLSPNEFRATYDAFLERLHPDDRRSVDRII
ncbi:MAG: PAS domain S-box protein, partial [Thermoanaerobaculia bacterium]|nr:PAS domain S-box protein [Thermoanaerobaculia bacterium]